MMETNEQNVTEEVVTDEIVTEEVTDGETTAEVIAEETVTEEVAPKQEVATDEQDKPACEKKKCHKGVFVGIFSALFVIVAVCFFVTIYNVKWPSYTYYNSDGEAVAIVEYAGPDLISAWNVCAADTMAISDDQKSVLTDKGYTLIFNDYAVQISDTKAELVTGAGSDDEYVYAVITTIKDSDGNDVDVETAVQNLAIAVTSGAYTTRTNSWIGRFFN